MKLSQQQVEMIEYMLKRHATGQITSLESFDALVGNARTSISRLRGRLKEIDVAIDTVPGGYFIDDENAARLREAMGWQT